MTEALRTDPIVRETWIGASPETVFAFFVEPAHVTRWLAEEATLDPRPGGICHQTHVSGGRSYHLRGEFIEVTPPTRVAFTWGFEEDDVGVAPGASTVEVTLTAEDGGTRVRLVHRDLPEPAKPDHSAGWTSMLARLATAVGGGDPDSSW
jgi:uncharacterized protein YndB with AHSA1/START domain